jgi:hypothetical protein
MGETKLLDIFQLAFIIYGTCYGQRIPNAELRLFRPSMLVSAVIQYVRGTHKWVI